MYMHTDTPVSMHAHLHTSSTHTHTHTTHTHNTHPLEMQQYIDISSYCDTLGSDTVSIHI